MPEFGGQMEADVFFPQHLLENFRTESVFQKGQTFLNHDLRRAGTGGDDDRGIGFKPIAAKFGGAVDQV